MTTRRSGSRSRRSALHIDHRATNGSRFSGAISSHRAPRSPSDWHTFYKSTHLPDLDDDVIAVLAEQAFGNASPRSYAAMFHLKGAVAWRPGEDDGGRDTAWVRTFFAALDRYREGVYVNFLGADEQPGRVREAYGDAYERLAEVKTMYDPDNVFRHNQNIRPAATRPSPG